MSLGSEKIMSECTCICVEALIFIKNKIYKIIGTIFVLSAYYATNKMSKDVCAFEDCCESPSRKRKGVNNYNVGNYVSRYGDNYSVGNLVT